MFMAVINPLTPQRVVQVADNLPSAPRVLAELQELLKDANNGIDEVSGLLRRDAGLTARVMRIANGIVYNKGDPVVSLEEAMGRVGFNEVYRLAGMASLAEMSGFQLRFYGVSAARLRENSLLTALLMEEWTMEFGANSRLAFTVGLMRSVGKIALEATAQKDRPFQRATPIGSTPLLRWEAETFGPKNNDVAAAVLRGWKFPADLYVPVRDHYLHNLAVDPLPLAKFLNLAAAAAEAAGFGMPGEAPYWAAVAAALPGELGLAPELITRGTERACSRFEKIRMALD